MNTIIKLALVATLAIFAQNVNAQDDPISIERELQDKEDQLEYLKAKRELLISGEKEVLKRRVVYINQKLEKGEITQEEAEKQKKEFAEKAALNIENETAIIDNQIALVNRNGKINNNVGTQVVIGFGQEDGAGKKIYGLSVNDGKVINKKNYDTRTISSFVMAVGFSNNLIDGSSLGDTYSIGRSGFTEFGWSWATRILDNSNALRFKYGFSFNFTRLAPVDEQILVDTGEQTILAPFEGDLRIAQFRNTQLIIPVFLELGPSKRIQKEDYVRYSTHKRFKLGLGGFAGLNIGTKQKIISTVDGDRVKENTRKNFNTNNFVYGLNGYVGVGSTSLYVKYDLNPLFKNNPVEQNILSLGIRFDFD